MYTTPQRRPPRVQTWRAAGPALLLALAGCFWKPVAGPAPLAIALGPPSVMSRVSPKGAHLEVAVRAGSASDPVGQEGLAWLVAHGIAEGGTARRRPEEIAALLGAWEGVLTVSVDPEIARFTLDVSPEHAEDAADLLGELITAPGLDPGALSRLAAQAAARLRDEIPAEGVTLADQLLWDWIFQGHPYGHPCVGRVGVVGTLTPQDVRRFYEERYLRSALVGGAATASPAAPLARLQGALAAASPRLSPNVTPRPVPPAAGRRVLAVRGPAGGAWIAVGMRAPALRDDPDRAALKIAAEVLRARLAAAQGTPLWVDSEPFRQADQGVFEVTVQAAGPDQGPAALKAAVEAVTALALQGVSQSDLEGAREALLSARARTLGDPDLALASALRAAALGGADPLDTLADQLAGLDAAACNAALGRQLHPQDLRIVAVVPDPEIFLQALREEPPVSSVQGASAAEGNAAGPPPPGGYVLGIGGVLLSSAQELLR